MTKKITLAIIVFISAILLMYSGYRALTLSFTIDESETFNTFVPLGFMDIISYRIVSANNHILNTLLMKFFSFLFGNSEFVLRLPNFMAHFVYLTFSYLILKKLSDNVLVLCGFLLLNLNPYLLDFFSIARGYGLAVAWMMGSIYYFIDFHTTNDKKKLTLALVFAYMSVLSNFSLLIYFASLVIIINLIWITSVTKKLSVKDLIKQNIPLVITLLLLFIVLYEPIRKLVKFGGLYSGGENGFWTDTVGSLVDTSLYGQPYFSYARIVLLWFIFIVIIAMSITFIYDIIKTKHFLISNLFTLFFFLLLLPCFVSICQHLIIGSKFLINRMAIFFIPLFFISIVYFINHFVYAGRLVLLKYFFIISLTLFVSIHTALSTNTKSFLSWRFDAQTKEMLNDLQTIAANEHKTKIKLGISWLYQATINYYIQTKKYSWISKVENEGPKPGDYDYYYIMQEDKSFVEANSKKIIKEYSVSRALLIK